METHQTKSDSAKVCLDSESQLFGSLCSWLWPNYTNSPPRYHPLRGLRLHHSPAFWGFDSGQCDRKNPFLLDMYISSQLFFINLETTQKLHQRQVWRFFCFFSRVHNHIIAHSAHKNRHEVSDLSGTHIGHGRWGFFVATKDGVVERHDQCLCFFYAQCGICRFYETCI